MGLQGLRHRHSSAQGFLRRRDKRLGVVETASVDARRKLLLVRRDDVEHLIMIGGPLDLLIETGIKGRPHLEPPLEDVIIAKSETRPAPGLQPKIGFSVAARFSIDCGLNATVGFACGRPAVEVNKWSELMAAMCCWGRRRGDAGNFIRSCRKNAGSSLLMVRHRLASASHVSPPKLSTPRPPSGEFFYPARATGSHSLRL